MDCAADVLAKQSDALSHAAERNLVVETELEAADIESLKMSVDEANSDEAKQEQEVDGIRSELERFEEDFVGMDRGIELVEDEKASIRAEIDEQKRKNSILEQRFESEKTIAQQTLKAQINGKAKLVEQDSFNMVAQLRDKMDLKNENEKMLQEVTAEIEEEEKANQQLEDWKAEKSALKQNLDGELKKPAFNKKEQQARKRDLVKSIKEQEKKAKEVKEETDKRCQTYETKIEKEKRRQILIGGVDDDEKSSSKSSEESESVYSVYSKISSSIDIDSAEKVDESSLDMSTDFNAGK